MQKAMDKLLKAGFNPCSSEETYKWRKDNNNTRWFETSTYYQKGKFGEATIDQLKDLKTLYEAEGRLVYLDYDDNGFSGNDDFDNCGRFLGVKEVEEKKTLSDKMPELYKAQCPFCNAIKERKRSQIKRTEYCRKCHNWFKTKVTQEQCICCENKAEIIKSKIIWLENFVKKSKEVDYIEINGKKFKHYGYYCKSCFEQNIKPQIITVKEGRI